MSVGNRYLMTYRLLRTAYSERFDEIASKEGDTVDAYRVERDRLAHYIDSHGNKSGTWNEGRALRVAVGAADDAWLELGGRLAKLRLEKMKENKVKLGTRTRLCNI